MNAIAPGIVCPLCHHAGVEEFFAARGVPVTCASVFDTPAEASAVPGGDIDLVACQSCGFAFNRSFDPGLGEVGARYESSQAASAHFSAFAKSLADGWVSRYGLRDATVLEVGSGGGHFLQLLLDAGAGKVVGIDPFAAGSDTPSNLQLIADVFHERHLGIESDALVCRHTLEHVAQVNEFLQLVSRWAHAGQERVVLFEVPDAGRVFAERAFWDVYYEHCNYFTVTTLRHAFELAGLEILDFRLVYGDQYLIVEARARQAARSTAAPIDAGAELRMCREFGRDARSSIERCQGRLTRLAHEAPPLVLWQGAAKTVGFLAMLPDAGVIHSAVDVSPQRKGKFLPASALPVFAPEALRQLQPGNIVLMNPVYLDEVRESVRKLGVNAVVHAINELLG